MMDAISLTIGPQATEDKWSTLENSTDQNDLKKITILCKDSFKDFNEKIKNTKNIANRKLPELNNTTEDIANLVSEIKTQVKDASADLVKVRKLVQKSALRFRDTFKSLVSFTELDSESVNKELESIQETKVDTKKPLVKRVIRSFGNRYDLNKLANKVLEISSDREKLKNNYDENKKIVKKEFNSLWNSLSNHSKTMNDNALNALNTFFEGIKSLKYVKKKVKTQGENALNEIKVGDEIINLKNAVELAKSLKLKFEDEWNLDSGELSCSEEQKKSSSTDENQSYIQENEQDKSNENFSINDIETGLPKTEHKTIENDNMTDHDDGREIYGENKASDEQGDNNLNKSTDDNVNTLQPEKTETSNEVVENDNDKVLTPELLHIDDGGENDIQKGNVEPENVTRETDDLDENKNKNSVEGADLKSIKNENILPTAESMGDESMEPNDRDHKKDGDNRGNTTIRLNSKRKDRKGDQELPGGYNIEEKPEYETSDVDENIETPHENPDHDSTHFSDGEHDPANTEYNQSWEHESKETNDREPKQMSEEEMDESNDIIHPYDGGHQPNTKRKHHRRRINREGDQQLPGGYSTEEKPEHESHEVDKNIDTFPESPDHDSTHINDGEHDPENTEHNQSWEHEPEETNASEPERMSYEDMDEPNDIIHPYDGGHQPNTIRRHHRRRINREGDQELPGGYSTDEKSEHESHEVDKNNKTSHENPDHDSTYFNDGEHDPETTEHNQSWEHEPEETNTGEPERMSYEDMDEPNDIIHPYDGGHQPKTKRRHHRRRINREGDQELPGGYSTDEKSEHESHEVDENNETPHENPDHDSTYFNDGEHDPETTEHNQSWEHEPEETNAGEPERMSYEDMDEPNDIIHPYDGGHQPKTKRRHHRRRINREGDQELPGGYSTDEKSEHESHEVDKNNETSHENPDHDSTYFNDGEHDPETTEHNQSWEHEPEETNTGEPERMSYEDMDEPNDIIHPYDGGHQPKTKRRHHRRRINREGEQELPGDYNTDEKPEYESYEVDENNETPHENPDHDSTYFNDGEHDPETTEHNQSWEHEPEETNTGEQERMSYEDMDEPNDIIHPYDGGHQPKTKRRHHRRRINREGDQELPGGYSTDEKSEHESHEVDKNNETSHENPDHDSTYFNDGEHDPETTEHNQSWEHEPEETNTGEPERMSYEDMDEPNDIIHPYDGGHQPKTKRRHHRRRINREGDQELPGGYSTDEKSEHESHEVDKNNETSHENPDHDSTYFNDGEHDPETTEHNQSWEHEPEETNTGEPERMSYEDMDEPNDIIHPYDGGHQPKTKRRHHRRRINREGEQELPGDYNTDEKPEYESYEVDENNETPHENPDHDSTYFNDGEHDPETTEHNQSWEHEPEETNTGEPERMSYEDMDEPNDIIHPYDGGHQPKTKRRHHRRRINREGDQELPGGYSTDEKSEHESHEVDKNNETSHENPDHDSTYFNDGEHDPETTEHNQSWEHEPEETNTGEPERMSYEDMDEPNDIIHPYDGGHQPKTKRRHHRRRINREGDQELPGGYSTDEKSEHESHEVDENNETPHENPDHDSTYFNDGEHDPETTEHNQSWEHEPEETNAGEPERMSYEDMDEPNDIIHPYDGGHQPKTKRRHHRRRINREGDQELPGGYSTDEKSEHESHEVDENNETPHENPDHDSTYFNDGEHDPETTEHNQSWEHEPEETNTGEPERMSYEDMDEPNDIIHPYDGGHQPKTKRRHHRRRINREGDQELPGGYSTDEKSEHESHEVDKNNETSHENPDHDSTYFNDGEHDPETTEHNQSWEHEPEETNTGEPERMSYEDMDEPNDIIHPYDGGHQPKTKRRHHRRRINREGDQELPGGYSTDEKSEHESHEVDKNNETSHENPDHDSTYFNYGEHDPAISENIHSWEHIDGDYPNDGDYQPNTKWGHYRRRKNREDDQELPGDYNTDEKPEYESPEVDAKIETPPEHPDYDSTYFNDGERDPANTEYNQSWEHEPEETNAGELERMSYEDMDEPNDGIHPNDGDNQHNSIRRRYVRRKNRGGEQKLPGGYNTDEKPEYESPEVDAKIETPPEHPDYDTTYFNDGERDPANTECNQSWEHQPEESNAAEPERISYEDMDEPNDIIHSNDVGNQPNTIRRRHVRRKNREDDQELPGDYNTDENPEHESHKVDENIETLPESPDHDSTHFNDGEHDPAIPEIIHSWEHTDSDHPNDGDYQPNTKWGHYRRRKNREDDQELPGDYNTDEKPEYESPEVDAKVESTPEIPDQDTTYFNHGEYDPANPEYNQSWDHEPEVTNAGKPERMSDAETDELKDRDYHRRQKYRENDQELPRGYITDGSPDYESPDLYENIETPKYSDNAIETPSSLPPDVVNETINGRIPQLRIIRRRRILGQPNYVNVNYNEPEVVNDRNVSNYSIENQFVKNNNCPCNGKTNLNISSHIHGTRNSKQPRRTAMKNPTADNITPHYGRIQNDEESVRNLKTRQNYPGINQKKKRRLIRIITYKVNKATNERIKVNEQTYTTTDGLPHTPRNKLESIKTEDSVDPNTNKDNNDYSSFLFKEYNTDQCKRDAYDRFKEVHSQKAKDVVYQIFLDTNKMRSNLLTTVKNAIGNVKDSKTINDVDQSLRTVSNSLKTDLKETVRNLVTNVTPLAMGFLKTAKNLRCRYKKGPRTTYKMLSNICKNESTIPDSAKDVLKLISPQFEVDELIDNILEKPCTSKTLKDKKAKAQSKLIDLSKHMDTAISNIDCCVLSAMSSVGIGADTLKLLKSGKVIMSDEHPRVKTLRDAMGIIKSGKKIIDNNQGFTSTLTPLDGTTENDKYDDDEDPDNVAQENENILKTVPDLEDNMTLPKKDPNKRHPLGVIVVHPNNDIDYKEVTNTSQLKKFVGDQSKKYKSLYKNNNPTFLKPNNNKLFHSMVADVKKKAETNGMSKK
ncbi:hypothetical protein ACI65C_012008 [Semiaphis heraclei]